MALRGRAIPSVIAFADALHRTTDNDDLKRAIEHAAGDACDPKKLARSDVGGRSGDGTGERHLRPQVDRDVSGGGFDDERIGSRRDDRAAQVFGLDGRGCRGRT